jgi:hypothetical protein
MKKPAATKPQPKPRSECMVTGTPARAVAVFAARGLCAVAYLGDIR